MNYAWRQFVFDNYNVIMRKLKLLVLALYVISPVYLIFDYVILTAVWNGYINVRYQCLETISC